MWADTLFRAEQQHLLRLLLWAGLSIVAGTSVMVIMTVRRFRSPLLAHFAMQMGVWGAILGGIAALEWRHAGLRDVSGAARLERLLWMNVGFDAGYVAVGTVLACSAWLLARRLAGVGAGIGILVQGLALLLIDLQFAAVASR